MISIILSTRGRPTFMERLWKSVYETATNKKDLEICFYIDLDDSISQFQFDQMKRKYGSQIKAKIGPRIIMSQMTNEAASIAEGEYLQMAGDDVVFRTNGWDEIVLEAFKEFDDKILFVYGNDLYQPTSFGTHGCVHKNWQEAVGYIAAPYFSADFADTWLNDISAAIGRKRFLPYITEHLHVSAGKAPMDQTYSDNFARTHRDNNSQLYFQLESKRREDIQKLQQYIDTYECK